MKRILIVDDIEENLYLLRVLLEGHGYEVEQARNGSEAIVKALTTIPNIVISDILMPVIDGYTLCRIWKADERLKQAPFIFYTATYTDPRDERLAMDMGADAFIVKPADPDEFLRRIEAILAREVETMLSSPQEPKAGNETILKNYNETLIRKLEHKMFELEELNRELEELNQELESEIAAKSAIERNLRESEELFRNIFHQHAAVKIIIDPDTGSIIDANEAAVNFYGWPIEQLMNMKIQDFNTLPAGEVKAAMEMVGTKERTRFEFRHRRADGSIRDVEVFSSTIQLKGRNLLHSIIHDITDRKRAEDALRESEKLFRLITDNMSDAIWMMDLDFRYTYASPSLLKMRGYTFEEIKYIPMNSLLTPESHSLAVSIIAEELTPDRMAQKDLAISRTMALENYRKDGSTFWSEITMSLLRDPAGAPIGLLGVGRDITDRKRAEEAISKSLREKEILLKEIHHRVKNNMQVISSLISLQSYVRKNGDVNTILKDVQNRILSIAMIHEELYMSNDYSRIDFREFTGKIMKNLVMAFDTGEGNIDFMIKGGKMMLGIDFAVPCGLVVNELLSNAMKYAFVGGRKGVIRVKLAERGEECTIAVQDDGVGLPPDVDFEKPGTLGLKLVNILTKQIDGTITVNRGKGTEFVLMFKRKGNDPHMV